MTHRDKIKWMRRWARDHNVELDLDSMIGNTACIGVLVGNVFVRVPTDAWFPPRALREDDLDPCIAVRGTGKQAEAQLYTWLRWLEAHDFKIVCGEMRSP